MRTQGTRRPLNTTLATVLLSLLAVGCGPHFDPSSKVQSLRIFAVQKSEPYAKPGTIEHLTMLWDDPPDKAGSVNVTWFSGCSDPAGDLYYNCFKELTPAATARPAADCNQEVRSGSGNTFCFKIPADIVSRRPPPRDAKQPEYGLSYVFFAACAGTLGPAPPGQSFPAACFDASGRQLGPDDFVAGYTAIYSYDKLTNANPTIQGFAFNGAALLPGAYCIDGACQSPAPAPPVSCDGKTVPCVAACPDDGGTQCPEHAIKPLIPRSDVELDDVSAALGEPLQEQMWIRYYVDRGSVKSGVRLLNDAVKGWNSDYGTTFRAPKKKGPMHIWAVAQDNRGGVSWIRVPVIVQ